MNLDFNRFESRIEANEKRLDYENNRYQQTQSKIAYLTILYSIISIYLIQLFQFAFCSDIPCKWVFIIFLCIYLAFTILSVVYAISLLVPKTVAYTHPPKYFFEDIREKYIAEEITEDNELDLYLKVTYNIELEETIESNNSLNNRKSYLYNNAFRFGLMALLPYVLCIAFYFTHYRPELPSIKIDNYRDILRCQDSLSKCSK